MTLRDITRALNVSAMSQPNTHMIVEHDVFRINESVTQKYGIFAWLEGTHRLNADTSDYSFTLFWVDRLTADNGNEMQLRSEGVETLRNIIRRMEERYNVVASIPTLHTFTQRFVDLCAGAYAEVTFTAPNTSICEDASGNGDYNFDYNADFLIF